MATPKDKSRQARLDAETGTIRKRWPGHVHVALVYPNHYAVGMANLGFQSVYRQLNDLPQVLCERAFLPEPEERGPVPLTMESGRKLTEFDCVAFSIAFENDYTNVLTILHQAGLPLPSALRGASLPLVLAGGAACFLNPEPLAPFIDAFILGEAEAVLVPFFGAFNPQADRRGFLLHVARNLPGVYVPAFYTVVYGGDGTLAAFNPIEEVPARVRRVTAPEPVEAATQSVIVTPDTSFEDAYLIEVSRGCPRGCRFCAAGYIYRPPRMRPLALLESALAHGAERSGKIGLMGTAVSDLPDLKSLCAIGRARDLQLSFSSLRADRLDTELVGALKSGRLKTAAIAPETGSERMRRVINKGLDEKQILDAADLLVAGGIPHLKLYFMIGLPTETEEDVTALIALVKRIKHRFLSASRARGRMGEIVVSLNCFVPKPATPFQWVAMEEVGELKRKIKRITTGLKKTPNVRVQTDVPRWAHLQALLSRGDRRVADLLALAHRNQGNWPQTFKMSPLNASFYVNRERLEDEIFPWDFIDHGISRNFLWDEYQRARAAKLSPPCPMDPAACRLCGVCGPRV
jgi:radical SAM superfamily enzyme YgiQ (UPF0313 family)